MEDHLKDSECPDSIREFVRNNDDIIIDEYHEEGYNGEVYFGKRKKMGDEVVLKFYISTEDYDSSEEAVILQSIKHDNILSIYDLKFVPPSYAFFLSPKISGGNIQKFLENNPVSTKTALELIAGILKGVTELHSTHRLVHRDLKPSNILIDENSNPIIADLGSVKKISDANNYTTTSKSTTLYLAPECIINNQYNFQSDLYQVGLILFQLLGGHFPLDTPFEFLNPREKSALNKLKGNPDWNKTFDQLLNKKIIDGKLADINSIHNFLEKPFKSVLRKALHKDHTKRFQNPSEFLIEIHKLINKYPAYTKHKGFLHVVHSKGTEYKVHEGDKVIVEKSNNGSTWQKRHQHDGTFESALKLVRS